MGRICGGGAGDIGSIREKSTAGSAASSRSDTLEA